jgi:hypothetical protein
MSGYQRPKDGIASEMMWNACTGGGSCSIDCACGKTWEPGEEYNHLLEEDNWDGAPSFYFVELVGKCFVEECQGCKEHLARYENFIWHNRDTIRNYLSTRINLEKKLADQEKLLNTIAGID